MKNKPGTKKRLYVVKLSLNHPKHYPELVWAGLLWAAIAFSGLESSPSIAMGLDADGGRMMVDVQISLCSSPAKVQQGLALRAKGSPFNVWLFDDPALTLFAKGLRIRLREVGQGAELTLKAANQECSMVSVASKDEGKCEYDLHGTKIVGALSLTRHLDPQTARDLVSGRQRLADALSPAQKDFLQKIAGAWPIPLELRALGPTRVSSYRAKASSAAVDVSELPGGERFIEISRKVVQSDAAAARSQMEVDLAKGGVVVCADQSAQAVNKLQLLLGKQVAVGHRANPQ